MINGFYCRNRAHTIRTLFGRNPQLVGFSQALDQNLIVITRLNICHKDFVRHQWFYKFLLLGKRIRLLHIIHPIIHHTPDGRVPGARHGSHDFNGVLSVEYIVDSIPPADLDRIDLAHIKMFGGLLDVGNRIFSKCTSGTNAL